MTDHDEIALMVAAHALNALDRADERRVARHLATCKDCTRAYRLALDAVAALAASVDPIPPPLGLRGRILAALPAVTADEVVIDELAAQRALRATRRWRATTAATAVAAIAASILLAAQHRTIDDLRASQAVVAAAGPVVIVSGSTGHHVLLTTLKDAPAGRTYQVWSISPGTARPLSLGLVAGGGTLRLGQALPAGTTIAITVEPIGGSTAPTTPPIASVAI